MSSDSSTTGSYQGRPAHLDESNFIRRNRALHWARTGLSFIILIAAVTIIACEAVPLRHYKVTAAWADAGLALWPLNLDTRPTKAALACGCVIAVLNLAYITIALLPSVSINRVCPSFTLINMATAAFANQNAQYLLRRLGSCRIYHCPDRGSVHALPAFIDVPGRL